MGYEILTDSQMEKWNSYIRQLPNADVYFTFEYCKIYQDNGEGQAEMFVYSEGELVVCYPYLIRNLNELQAKKGAEIKEELFDITTPYGYGGPITNAKSDDNRRKKLFQNFSKCFGQYCQAKNIVTEFVRFHPIIQNYLDYEEVDPSFNRNTTCIDLSQTEQEILSKFRQQNRNRIRSAISKGLETVFPDSNKLEQLTRLYYSTMDRKQANEYYYFSEEFFKRTVRLLDGNIQLVEVKLDDKVIASSLFMHYNKFVHYHLMGANKDFLTYAPVNLLIHDAVKWAKAKGYHYLHLGGGYTGNDNLYRFKRTFNEKEALDYYIGTKIHIPEVYNKLVQDDAHFQQDYFPSYRHPALLSLQLLKTGSASE